jgi:hypothetical protein
MVFRARLGYTSWLLDHRVVLIVPPLCTLSGVSDAEYKFCGKKKT